MPTTPKVPVAYDQFQSAPRSEERGDPARNGAGGSPSCFNPRPAPRSGAIFEWESKHHFWTSFNPRPAPRSGAIEGDDAPGKGQGVSIRAPLRGAGRCSLVDEFVAAYEVSIRAPLRGAGRWLVVHDADTLREVSIRAPLRGAGRS